MGHVESAGSPLMVFAILLFRLSPTRFIVVVSRVPVGHFHNHSLSIKKTQRLTIAHQVVPHFDYLFKKQGMICPRWWPNHHPPRYDRLRFLGHLGREMTNNLPNNMSDEDLGSEMTCYDPKQHVFLMFFLRTIPINERCITICSIRETSNSCGPDHSHSTPARHRGPHGSCCWKGCICACCGSAGVRSGCCLWTEHR